MKQPYVLLPVPSELAAELGFTAFAILQYSIDGKKLTIELAEDTEFTCRGDCDTCPLYDGECKNEKERTL